MSIPPISSLNPEEQRSPAQTGGYVGSPWTGWIAFAGTVMVILGLFHVVQGLVALLDSGYYLVGSSGLVLHANYTAWGWIQLLGGVAVAAAGMAVFTGQVWARAVGVVLAGISAVINIGFLGAYPLWSLMMIALDMVIIHALTVHGDEMRPDRH